MIVGYRLHRHRKAMLQCKDAMTGVNACYIIAYQRWSVFAESVPNIISWTIS